jgi:hypothetical protein
MARSWESRQLILSSDGGDDDRGTEDSVRFPKSLMKIQFDDTIFLSIMEHTKELIQATPMRRTPLVMRLRRRMTTTMRRRRRS